MRRSAPLPLRFMSGWPGNVRCRSFSICTFQSLVDGCQGSTDRLRLQNSRAAAVRGMLIRSCSHRLQRMGVWATRCSEARRCSEQSIDLLLSMLYDCNCHFAAHIFAHLVPSEPDADTRLNDESCRTTFSGSAAAAAASPPLLAGPLAGAARYAASAAAAAAPFASAGAWPLVVCAAAAGAYAVVWLPSLSDCCTCGLLADCAASCSPPDVWLLCADHSRVTSARFQSWRVRDWPSKEQAHPNTPDIARTAAMVQRHALRKVGSN